jgi:hypothetical protein
VLVCVGGFGAWRFGASVLRLLVLRVLVIGSARFSISYGCALARTRHARAHNSGTTDATDETDMSGAFSCARAVHTSSLRARTNAPTISRNES